MVLICGALLHDIGRTMSDEMHGLIGGAMAEELLRSLGLGREEIDRITKVIVRHTVASHVAPESVEERIVYDADGLDRLGAMGLLRGFMGKREESMAGILERYMSKRVKDYDKLFFPINETSLRLLTEFRTHFNYAFSHSFRREVSLSAGG